MGLTGEDLQVYMAALLNQLVQHSKKTREILEREVDRGQIGWFDVELTTEWQDIDFRIMWKRVDLTNKGDNTALLRFVTWEFITETPRLPGQEFTERENDEINLDADDRVQIHYKEDRLISLRARAETGTTRIKFALSR